MARGFPYTSHPTGWFVVGLSDELKAGEVKPIRYFSQDLVMYRGESGKVHVFDAHCKHNGAHLGYGGKVWGDDIVCPFHAWRWDCDGNNVDIPYSRILHNKARLKKWHVWEEAQLIQLWHDAEGVEPYWEPMQLPTNRDLYYPLTMTTIHLKDKPMYPQFFIENIADPAHIKYVHKAPVITSFGEYRWNGANWGQFCDEPRPRFGTQGMSMIVTRGHPVQPQLGDYDYSNQVNGVATAPVDPCVTDVFLPTYIVKEEGYPDTLGPRAEIALRKRQHNIQLDFFLFDYCIYLDGPPWPPEESKQWIDVRHWARQFYPADTGIRSIPTGQGKGAEFPRQEDSIVGGRRGMGPKEAYSGGRSVTVSEEAYR